MLPRQPQLRHCNKSNCVPMSPPPNRHQPHSSTRRMRSLQLIKRKTGYRLPTMASLKRSVNFNVHHSYFLQSNETLPECNFYLEAFTNKSSRTAPSHLPHPPSRTLHSSIYPAMTLTPHSPPYYHRQTSLSLPSRAVIYCSTSTALACPPQNPTCLSQSLS